MWSHHSCSTTIFVKLHELSKYVVAEILVVQAVLLAASYTMLSRGG
jgi:hypothetical protein